MSLSIPFPFWWLLDKTAARVEVNISLAFLYRVRIALHPWPVVSYIAIFVLKRDGKLQLTNTCMNTPSACQWWRYADWLQCGVVRYVVYWKLCRLKMLLMCKRFGHHVVLVTMMWILWCLFRTRSRTWRLVTSRRAPEADCSRYRQRSRVTERSDVMHSLLVSYVCGVMAQWVERWICNQQVVGSNPTHGKGA